MPSYEAPQSEVNDMKARLSIMVAVLTLFLPSAALAQRFVVLNGQLLNQSEISLLDAWACTSIPNGYYWMNFNTGIWGYAGDPRPRGHISDYCRGPERRPSLSERGLLYSPGELLR
jgi:hypothetical protein